MDASFDYSNWTDAELARAELTAEQFLAQNNRQIAVVFQRQRAVLDRLVELLRNPNLTLEERLDCFARIAETAEGLRECANGFFELGAQPLVARVIGSRAT
ncbi:MAG TPA: hypothetical protein VKB79_03630 [Bryobacteraceae bacterium]|nr:hypothetical protein [Bryobacteraceae bacterium]